MLMLQTAKSIPEFHPTLRGPQDSGDQLTSGRALHRRRPRIFRRFRNWARSGLGDQENIFAVRAIIKKELTIPFF